MAKKYVVQGSPGRYVVNEAKTQEEIRSGMTYSAALQTANTLNAKANREKKEEASQTSPTSTRYGTNYEPVVKSSDISQVIKNVYLRNGWSKKDIDSYFQGRPWQVSTAWLLQDIKNGKIKMPPSLPGEKDAFANLQENLSEARSKGESKYLNQYNLYLPKRPELPEKPGVSELGYDEITDPVFKEIINNINADKPATKDLSDTRIKQYLNDPVLNDIRTRAGRVKSLSDEILIPINEDIEKAGGMTPEIIERIKVANNEINTKVTEIIADLGINPNGLEGKAFAEGLKVGGEKAVEELFGRNRKPGTPMKAPSGEKGPKFGWDEAKNFGIEYEIPKGSGTEGTGGDDYTGDDFTGDDTGDDFTGDDTGGDDTGGDDNRTQSPTNTEQIDLNNIPVGSQVWDVDGTLYLAYAVPGAGDLYEGSTIWMAYDVVGNDLFEAGLLTEGFNYTGPNMSVTKEWFDKTAIIGGNTNQLIGIEDDPFASFVETYKEEAALRPWLLDNDFIELQAEAALENRDISPTEWQSTTWYQTHSQAERDWMDIELSDPAEAKRKRDDLELYFKNQLQGLGVAGVPDGLVQWVTNKNITGEWSDLKTAEQLQLFADPFKSGYRDEELLNLISTSGFGDVDRTAAREKEVVELYRKWLGPSLGSLTQDEVANIAGRMRDDPDYEDALINSLKQSRLAAFSNYTNPELTYEDIARPWRNLTTSVWGQNADETQGWWQEMVKSNDYTTAQATLRERGLENNIAQVNIEATEALQQALGQGSVSQSGVNV